MLKKGSQSLIISYLCRTMDRVTAVQANNLNQSTTLLVRLIAKINVMTGSRIYLQGHRKTLRGVCAETRYLQKPERYAPLQFQQPLYQDRHQANQFCSEPDSKKPTQALMHHSTESFWTSRSPCQAKQEHKHYTRATLHCCMEYKRVTSLENLMRSPELSRDRFRERGTHLPTFVPPHPTSSEKHTLSPCTNRQTDASQLQKKTAKDKRRGKTWEASTTSNAPSHAAKDLETCQQANM